MRSDFFSSFFISSTRTGLSVWMFSSSIFSASSQWKCHLDIRAQSQAGCCKGGWWRGMWGGILSETEESDYCNKLKAAEMGAEDADKELRTRQKVKLKDSGRGPGSRARPEGSRKKERSGRNVRRAISSPHSAKFSSYARIKTDPRSRRSHWNQPGSEYQRTWGWRYVWQKRRNPQRDCWSL